MRLRIPRFSTETALFGCAATCSLYAVILSTRRGRRLTLNYTEWTVVVGVSLVLGWIATTRRKAALMALAFFAAGGAPMVLRSWWLRESDMRSAIDYYQHSNDDGDE